MASIITATTTSGLTQSADNSGVLQLASGTGNLVTIPSVTGTAMVSGNMPAFSAYNSANQSISSGTFTKAQFNLETFDTNNCFDSATNYRFTPNVAGYYQFSSGIYTGGNNGFFGVTLFKNGGGYAELGRTTSTTTVCGGSTLAYANGSTDYFEIYAYTSGSGLTMGASGSTYFWFTGSLVRAA